MDGVSYRDRGCSPGQRAADLLGRMTLQEKVAQLGCRWATAFMDGEGVSYDRVRELAPDGIGEVARVMGSTSLGPREAAKVANALQRFFVEETRLGIPAIVHEEGTGGLSGRGATVFPQAIALAATFDPGLVEEVAAVVRQQMLAVGARHCLAPVLDVARDPRWGRVEETFGEDPVLVAALGAAYVRGLQGDDLASGVLATGKHFVAHGASVGGRNHGPVQIGPRDLRDVYVEPFALAVREGLASVMNAYSSVDGLPCASARSVLTDLLRGELAFGGMVVSDYESVSLLVSYHHVAADKEGAAALSLAAGMDLEMPETDCFGVPLLKAVQSGALPEHVVDAAVMRVLKAKFALGLFDRPFVDEGRAVVAFDSPPQRQLARRAAERSVVLLVNDGLLPLSSSLRRVAVVGPAADDRRLLQGDYHYPSHQEIFFNDGSPDAVAWPGFPARTDKWRPRRHFTEHVTPLEGVRAIAPEACEVVYAKGCDVTGDDTRGIAEAARVAAGCEVAIVVVGGRSGLTRTATVGESRDATRLELTGAQTELVRAVVGSGVPTVVVVMSGRVHSLSDLAGLGRALLFTGPLGEEGGTALAEVLFGRLNPSGRLPVSVPRSVGQVPVHVGQRRGGSTAMSYGEYTDSAVGPLFAFGHGLSYTSFGYGEMVVAGRDTRHPVRIEVEVSNVGPMAGEEVVQLYCSDLVASVARPERQLVGFLRVALRPGERRKVVFEVHPSRLAFVDEGLRRVIEPGEFRFEVGSSSADLRAVGTVQLGGEVVEYPIAGIVATSGTVVQGK